MTDRLFITSFRIEENPTDPEKYDCCPHCGSLGVLHFADKDDGKKFHRCLRCNGAFYGCTSSPSDTLAVRLTNVGELSN